jgi:hypothetical protein
MVVTRVFSELILKLGLMSVVMFVALFTQGSDAFSLFTASKLLFLLTHHISMELLVFMLG